MKSSQLCTILHFLILSDGKICITLHTVLNFKSNYMIIPNIYILLKNALSKKSSLKPNIIQNINELSCGNSVISISTYCAIIQRGSWKLLKWLNLFALVYETAQPNIILTSLCLSEMIYLFSHCSCQVSFLLMITAQICTVLESLQSTFPYIVPSCDCLVVPF